MNNTVILAIIITSAGLIAACSENPTSASSPERHSETSMPENEESVRAQEAARAEELARAQETARARLEAREQEAAVEAERERLTASQLEGDVPLRAGLNCHFDSRNNVRTYVSGEPFLIRSHSGEHPELKEGHLLTVFEERDGHFDAFVFDDLNESDNWVSSRDHVFTTGYFDFEGVKSIRVGRDGGRIRWETTRTLGQRGGHIRTLRCEPMSDELAVSSFQSDLKKASDAIAEEQRLEKEAEEERRARRVL